MIKKIVNTFFQIAKEHKLVRSFRYDKLSKSQGTGEENYPQVFLEDSILIDNSTTTGGTSLLTLNFDVTMTPQAFNNFNVRQLSVEECQNVSMEIALNIIAKLRDMQLHYDEYDDDDLVQMSVERWNFLTLRNWYDNDCAGVRCTLICSIQNEINFCDLEEHFDPNKEFDLGELLSDIDTDSANSCINFTYKLPRITL